MWYWDATNIGDRSTRLVVQQIRILWPEVFFLRILILLLLPIAPMVISRRTPVVIFFPDPEALGRDPPNRWKAGLVLRGYLMRIGLAPSPGVWSSFALLIVSWTKCAHGSAERLFASGTGWHLIMVIRSLQPKFQATPNGREVRFPITSYL
jgi:hypothetical protein